MDGVKKGVRAVYMPPALVLALAVRSHRFALDARAEESPSETVTVTDDGLPTVTPVGWSSFNATVNVSS